MSESTNVAVQKPRSLGEELKAREPNFVAALPAHIPAERFIRVVLTAVQSNPALAHADRPSLWTASMRAAQDGLLPDGREGALVIYRTKDGNAWIDKVQWMPMIAGLRKKVRNSGEIKDWNAHVVYAKDMFEFELGDFPYIKHKPCLDGDPGEVIAAYSVARFGSGEVSREVMTRAQIDKVRGASRSRDKGPWVDWFEEMCRKTVARRHAKVLPMSTDLDDLIRRDDALYDLDSRSDKQVAPPHKTLGDRLAALAGDAAADPLANTNPGAAGTLAGRSCDSARHNPLVDRQPEDGGRGPSAADLISTGDARAAAGEAALRDFLDGLTAYEASLISPDQRRVWSDAASRVAAATGEAA